MGQILLQTIGLSKRYCRRPELALRYACSDVWRELRGLPPREVLRPGEFWAVRNVDITLEKGEVLGVVGHNGAGKSTLINLLAGLVRPTTGAIHLYTDRVALMDHNGGLNPIETGRENIATQLALHGCPDHRIAEESEAAIAFAELGDFMDAAVGTYSVGMRLRLAFSIYTRLNPDLFIVDEAISGGDMRFRQRFQNYIKQYLDSGGSMLFCSHELFLLQTLCPRSILMEGGCLKMAGETVNVVRVYQEMMLREATPPEPDVPVMTQQQLADQNELLHEDSQNDQTVGIDKPARTPTSIDVATVANTNEQLTSLMGVSLGKGMPIIRSFSIKPEEGEHILPGKPVIIEMVCTAVEAVDTIIWGIEFFCKGLETLATMIGGYGEHKYKLEAGTNVFRARIEHLPLAPGAFTMRTGVLDIDSGATLIWYGFEEPPIPFTVTNPEDILCNILVYRKSLLYMDIAWSTGMSSEDAIEEHVE